MVCTAACASTIRNVPTMPAFTAPVGFVMTMRRGPMLNRLRWWRGLWRLRFGLCPACYSSPPDRTCPVCAGNYAYGPRLADGVRVEWRKRFAAQVGRGHD